MTLHLTKRSWFNFGPLLMLNSSRAGLPASPIPNGVVAVSLPPEANHQTMCLQLETALHFVNWSSIGYARYLKMA